MSSPILAYIAACRPEVQPLLTQLYDTILAAAPMAEEKLSYGMPCFAWHGNLVYFMPHARHIGFYPTASGIAAFHGEFGDLRFSKGAVQFPLDRPLPLDLVARIVSFRVEEQERKMRGRSLSAPRQRKLR